MAVARKKLDWEEQARLSLDPELARRVQGHRDHVGRQRGRIEIEVSFKGISAHGSAPERGKNAVYMASRACLEIEKLNEQIAGSQAQLEESEAAHVTLEQQVSALDAAKQALDALDKQLTAAQGDIRLAENQAVSFEEYEALLEIGIASEWPESVPEAERSLIVKEVMLSCTHGMLLCLDRPHRITFIKICFLPDGQLMMIESTTVAEPMPKCCTKLFCDA